MVEGDGEVEELVPSTSRFGVENGTEDARRFDEAEDVVKAVKDTGAQRYARIGKRRPWRSPPTS